MLKYKVTESTRLEKIIKIIKSDHQFITTTSKSTSSALSLNALRDVDSTTSLSSLFQCLTNLGEKKFLLISNLNLSWGRYFLSYCCYLGEETNFTLPQPPFRHL